MKHWLASLWLVAILASHADAQGNKDDRSDGLSVAILVGKDKNGDPVLDRGGEFQVVLTNRSTKPIRLWSEDSRLGHGTLSFLVEDGEGQPALMFRPVPSDGPWKNQPPKTAVVPPGGTFKWNVHPSVHFWGEREWKGVPEPNTEKAVRITAVVEIKPNEAAKEQDVWTGRITSEPLKVQVVDPKLRTPFDYLNKDCPKQALRMMQADTSWVKRQDDMQQTPLHVAVQFGFHDVARWLLAHEADVNATAYNKFKPLHFASDPEMVKLLIEHKADVNAENVSGGTPLQHAAERCAAFADDAKMRDHWRAITKLLLDAGAKYDIQSACYLDDLEQVQALVRAKNKVRDPELMRIAASQGRLKIVKLLLQHGADPEDADYGGLPLSYFAIEHADVLKALLEAGANPKVTIEYRGNGWGPSGSTLLHEAAEKGCLDSVKLLLAAGLDVDLKDRSGMTALEMACWKGQVAIVNLLLEKKASAKARPDGGRGLMDLAANEIRPDQDDDNARCRTVIGALEHAGVDLTLFAAIACDDVPRATKILQKEPKAAASKTSDGRPMLHTAVMLDRKEIVKLLLDNGCDADIRSECKDSGHEGGTALLEAAFWGRLELAELLIKRGAKVDAKSTRGVVPLHEAARMASFRRGQLDFVELLLKHGADVNAKDEKGKTPLDWTKSPEMIELLRSHGGRGKEEKK